VAILNDGRKWDLTRFIAFQYPKGLNPMCRPHASILSVLRVHGLAKGCLTVSEQLPKGIHTQQEKEKEQVQEKDSSIQGSPEGIDHDVFEPSPAPQTSQDSPTKTVNTGRFVRMAATLASASPKESPEITEESRWQYLKCQPWAIALRAAGCKVGANNFRHWQMILTKHSDADVVAAAAGVTERWPQNIEDALAASRGQANPGDVIASRIHKVVL
jgi:hypothetical protein